MERPDHIHLGLQYLLGRLAAVFTVPLIFMAIRLMGYRIRDLDRVREEVARLFREHEGPWIVCPNHLTMIDSPLLSYGMASLPDHILKFHQVPWNLPSATISSAMPWSRFCAISPSACPSTEAEAATISSGSSISAAVCSKPSRA